jgi:hypothetical protein
MVNYQKVAEYLIEPKIFKKCVSLVKQAFDMSGVDVHSREKVLQVVSSNPKKMQRVLKKSEKYPNGKNWSIEKYNSGICVGLSAGNPGPFRAKKSCK